MGHHDEPLTATYNTQRPPWLGIWSSRKYTGRPDWWKEPGNKDEMARHGKLRLVRSRYNEEDPDWFDPKVPDGTSETGPLGLDRTKHKDITKKGDTPGDLAEFQENVYKNSTQFKRLAAAFDLSKEHPGIAVSPSMNTLALTDKAYLGRNSIMPNSWYSFGPRFFDAPLNEGTFWKALAAMKYTAILMVPYTLLEIRGMETVPVGAFGPRQFFARYAKLSPLPLAVAASWAVALSSASNIRNKDDVYNHLYSSATVGAVVASAKDSVARGVTMGLVTLVAGVFWHYLRVSETGLQSRVSQPSSGGIWGGPLMWNVLNNGDASVPTTTF
ncbi:hypothetical protein PFISCL1PPCAC_6067 [Pristionchus fissidentatus]|uniref:Uncharacterized protein n=1 Tax=Pristionchus fissidentatus TaxID=1538716 RepID=A0AAV5V8B4_9BILA|nr:hypothetical protein PFISCL1PPCAC_6067 [Pristionchus fissidentatus]